MKRVKKILVKCLIVYVIFYLILGSMTSCFARAYDAACGEFLAQFTREFIQLYCTPTEEKTEYKQISHANWTGGSFGSGIFQACCNTGVRYMFELALGIELMDYDMQNQCRDDVTGLGNSPYWIDVTNQPLQPGDVLLSNSHMEMYLGNNENANFGNSPYAGRIAGGPRLGSDFTHAYRLSSTVDVTPSGNVPMPSTGSLTTSVNFSEFYFNGIPDGRYSVAHTNIWTLVVESILQIADYLIGLLTYISRMPFIGWTAIMDNLLNWTVNTVTDTGVTEDDLGIDSTEIEGADTDTETEVEDMEINSVEVEGADDDTRLTIDGLLYNDYDLTNINIFE